MDDHTLAKLDFDRIRGALVSHCNCSLGKELARRIRPATSRQQIGGWLDQVREIGRVAETIGLPPMGGVRDIRAHLERSGTPAGLEADALADVGETLAATGPLRAWFDELDPDCPHLLALSQRVADFTVPAASINEAIDPRGRLRDEASPKLVNIRGTVERAKEQIASVFSRLLRQTRTVRMLQYANATFHNDRMVLPLKSEHRGRITGIVHRTSDSGATLFVEPAEAVELNNSLMRLREEEKKEIDRILRALSRLVHENAPGALATLRAIAVLDLIVAKHRYALHRDGRCPELRDDGVMYLHAARHPVLLELFDAEGDEDPRQVVPIDVRLGDDFDLLLITGPNTGGKTVTLKTIGLMAVMTQSGIPIPAGPGSEMPVFDRVFIDVGDEQSLEQSLSTFSGHMSRVLEICRRAQRNSLVLVDELGAGTDPDEGTAIGHTVIDELLRAGARAVITTHLSALKAVGFTEKRADNASVEFDVESLRPTYHLRLGEPGNSNAIVVAERLGMPAPMARRARGYLSNRSRQLQEAIEGTLDTRRRAESARLAALKARLDADQSRERYEKKRQELDAREAEHRNWVEWINELKPGDDVYVRSFETTASVVRMYLHKQTALVSAGALDFEVNLRDLTAPENGDA